MDLFFVPFVYFVAFVLNHRCLRSVRPLFHTKITKLAKNTKTVV